MEKSVDDIAPQDLRCSCNRDSTTEDDPKEAVCSNRGILLRLRHLKPLDATSQGRGADWTYAISMGIACGVFVYVAINHLIAKGFKPQNKCYFDTPLFKFLAVLISVVMIWD